MLMVRSERHCSRIRAQKGRLWRSDVGTWLGVPPQIPAGHESGTREQRIDAGLLLWWIENEFGLAAFLPNRVVAGNRDLSKRLVIFRDAIAEYDVVRGVGEQPDAENCREPQEEKSPQKMLDSVSL